MSTLVLGGRTRILQAILAWSLATTVAMGAAAAFAAPAEAPRTPDRPPILILDGGLGDNRFYVTHWLGTVNEVAADGDARVLTSADPTWWSDEAAPDTYILTASGDDGAPVGSPLDPARIAWALDRLAERHPEGKTVLVAQGATGLSAREYIEDLGQPKQSTRADVIGLVMVGAPNGGLGYLDTYPTLDVWQPYAAGGGLEVSDLVPGSEYLATLDAGRFPNVVKAATIEGVAVTIAGEETDGVVIRADSRLATDIASSNVDNITLRARASEAWPLEATWGPTTKRGGATSNVVSDDEVDRLATARGFVTVPETQQTVRTFYETWFSGGAPTTHISSRLVMDVSGSMAQDLGPTTKLDAARRAGQDFADSLAARHELAASVPEDIGLILFNESATVAVAATGDASKVNGALAAATADGNTDVGGALTAAINSFDSSPHTADKSIVFLSDGIATVGMTTDEVLQGPVADAKRRGIRIETIALGGVEQADVDFLKTMAAETGGQYHAAESLYELRKSFLRARYASLGALAVDSEATLDASSTVDLGAVDEATRLLEVGIVSDSSSPGWTLLRDGQPIAETGLSASALSDGAIALAIVSPEAGAYSLELTAGDGSDRAHVFAVKQVDAFLPQGTAAAQDDPELLLLGALGLLMLLGIIITAVAAIRARRRRTSQATKRHDASPNGNSQAVATDHDSSEDSDPFEPEDGDSR